MLVRSLTTKLVCWFELLIVNNLLCPSFCLNPFLNCFHLPWTPGHVVGVHLPEGSSPLQCRHMATYVTDYRQVWESNATHWVNTSTLLCGNCSWTHLILSVCLRWSQWAATSISSSSSLSLDCHWKFLNQNGKINLYLYNKHIGICNQLMSI